MASCCKTYDPCLDNKINQIGSYASAARQSAQSSAASAAAADADAAAAAASAAAAAISAGLCGVYLGAFVVPPTTDNTGGPLQDGMLYYNTVSNTLFVWNGSSWSAIQDDEIYLGGFAVAPTLNNQGLPLQLGNLYWNSVTNDLWAYDGASWGTVDFNEFTPFLATGTTTARNLVTRFSEMPSIFDFGAVGDGVADDLPAFTAANNSGKLIFIPKPPIAYNVSAPIKMDNCAVLIDPNNTNWEALTDNGNISFLRGKQNGLTTPVLENANFWRFADRILVGEMANKWTGRTGSGSNVGNAWFADTVNYPGYLGANGKIVVSTSDYPNQTIYGDNPYAITAGVRSSDALQSVIGVGSCAINDTASTNAWGFIAEIERGASANQGTYGLEVAAKNKGSNKIAKPNDIYSGIYGIWLQGGGDSAFGGSPTAPSTAGVVILRGNPGAPSQPHTWNTGILFGQDSLTDGEAIAMSSRANYGAGTSHKINWYGSDGNVSSFINGGNDTPSTRVGMSFFSNGINFINNSSESCFLINTGPSSVNRVQVNASAASSPPIIEAAGSDTNIDLLIRPKGTANIRIGTHAAITTETLSGYIEIKDSVGNVRKLAVVS
jgi:hypothetical protein